jgi:hypothetical protein
MNELQRKIAALHLGAGETLCFLSHHKGGAGTDARLLKDRLSKDCGFPPDAIFLDSDQSGWTLDKLLDHVRRTRVLVLIQTEHTLFRPFVIGEIVAALQAGIPVVPVVMRQGGYDFTKAASFLTSKDFRAALEKDTPGCVAVLEKQGFNVYEAGAMLKETLPQLISIELDLKASEKRIAVAIEEIAEAILNAKKVAIAPKNDSKPVSPFMAEYLKAESSGELKKMAKLASMDGDVLRVFVKSLSERCKDEREGIPKEVSKENQRQLREAGTCETIVEGLGQWGLEDVALASEILNSVHFLARDVENNRKFRTLGALELVVQVLTKWGVESAKVAEGGCRAIGDLAADAENRKKFVTLDALELVVQVLTKWGVHNADVAEWGCRAIGILAWDEENKKKFCTLGVLELVVQVLAKWGVDDADVAFWGCRAYRNVHNGSPRDASFLKMEKELKKKWKTIC